MASLTYSNALLPLAGTDQRETTEAVRPGFFTRFVAALVESRRRQAEREIVRLERVYGIKLRPDASKDDATRDLPFNS